MQAEGIEIMAIVNWNFSVRDIKEILIQNVLHCLHMFTMMSNCMSFKASSVIKGNFCWNV